VKHHVPKANISKPAVQLLIDHHWPGNVRELENVIERAIILSDGEITPENLPPQILDPRPSAAPGEDMAGDNPLSLKHRVRILEESLIRRALELSDSNRTRAAKLLDVSHRTLLYKMQEYGIK
ncbi:MAG: helix-turn-helix domain-containing protein, partial [Candidatus Binatia bacterium]